MTIIHKIFISNDEFRCVDEDGPLLLDLTPDTTQGVVYRFLLGHTDQVICQRRIFNGVDVPKGSVGPRKSASKDIASLSIAISR